jgi:hypothetical protein
MFVFVTEMESPYKTQIRFVLKGLISLFKLVRVQTRVSLQHGMSQRKFPFSWWGSFSLSGKNQDRFVCVSWWEETVLYALQRFSKWASKSWHVCYVFTHSTKVTWFHNPISVCLPCRMINALSLSHAASSPVLATLLLNCFIHNQLQCSGTKVACWAVVARRRLAKSACYTSLCS